MKADLITFNSKDLEGIASEVRIVVPDLAR